MHRIQWRIAVPFVCLFVVCLGILGVYLASYVHGVQIDHINSQLTDDARLVSEISLPILINPSQQNQLDTVTKTIGREIKTRITIIAKDGTVLADTDQSPSTMENHATRPEVIAALASGIGKATRYSATLNETMMYVAVPITSQGQTLGVSRVALPYAAVQSSVNGIVITITLSVAIIALLVIIAAAVIARMITRPVRRITQAAEEIAGGKFGQQIPIRSGDEVGRLGSAFNEMSTNLKTLIENMSAEETKLATVLAVMTDGVVMTDKEGTIILANRAAGKLFGFIEDKAVARPFIEAVHDHEIDEMLKSCLKTGTQQTVQVETVSRRFLRAIAMPVSGEKISGALLLLQDLTEVRNIQTMRRELIGNISHDFRTPIAGIKAMVETLEEGAIDDRKAALDFLSRIDSEVDRLTQIVSELTELSLIETGKNELKLEPVNLNSLITEITTHMTPLAERQHITLIIQLATVPAIPADKDRIRQTIVNIIHNAIKFNRPGGSVTIMTEAGPDSVTVSVKDTGIGISQTDLPHIFERFYKADRARGGGSGIGLAIAKHTIQAHNGDISAESEMGKGSTFTFTLPVQRQR